MKVLILDKSAWREFRSPPASRGVNQTTHLAKIADATGKLHDCFVKLLPLTSVALLCEALGWILAHASGVECPKFGAVVFVPLDELRKSMALPPVFDGMAECPAWCCEVVAGNTVKQVHKMSYYVAQGNFLRSKDARAIASFDQWTDLRDRNYANVIRSATGGYVAIDHETLLHGLLWTPAAGWNSNSLLDEAKNRLAPKDFKRFQSDMAEDAKAHAGAIANVMPDVSEIVDILVTDDPATTAKNIVDVLSDRAQVGWLAKKLGVAA